MPTVEPYTEARICNLALMRIGVTDFIDSLEEATTAAQVCKLAYPHCRDVVLSSFPWPFASQRATLAQVPSAERTGWQYGYAYPTGALRPVAIWSGSRAPTPGARIPFSYETNAAGTGSVIWTDLNEAEFIYTQRITDTGRFSSLFVDALAWRVAAELAVPLTKDAGRRDAALKMFQYSVGLAAGLELASGHEAWPDSEIITSRY
jgi:hypothetical protein